MIKGLAARKTRKADSGVILLTVLILTATMGLVVVFTLSEASTGHSVAMTAQRTSHARVLGQNAVNIAIGQIREGTIHTLDDDRTAAPWTSQPGAIRVHDENGELKKLYKLYSSDSMITPDLEDALNDVPPDWKSRPAQYVDLNEPSVRTVNGEVTQRFPIADPSTLQSNSPIEGFSTTHAVPGELPMPVQWIYTLRDGTMGTLDHEGNFLSADPSVLASEANPISGRIAFWTDDETCKININTASEGVFWDIPRANTLEEQELANYQPAKGEFQRFSGHPAMVSLSPVFLPGFRYNKSGRSGDYGLMTEKQLFSLWELSNVAGEDDWFSVGGTQVPGAIGRRDRELSELLPPFRPYATSQEFLFPLASREELFVGEGLRVAEQMQSAGFFITEQNAAPELTLFGTPRIALWPVHDALDPTTKNVDNFDGTYRVSNYDRKIAHVSSINGERFYVTRNQAANGFGDFDLEFDRVAVNEKLFEYLQDLTDKPVPGFGGKTFADKYGEKEDEDRDNILLSMLDYVRQSNLNDGLLAGEEQFCVVCAGAEHVGYGQVAPLVTAKANSRRALTPQQLKAPRGIGRVPTISEVGFWFTCRAKKTLDGEFIGHASDRRLARQLQPGQRAIELTLLLECFTPGHGWGEYRPYMSAIAGSLPLDTAADVDPDSIPEMELCGEPLSINRSYRVARSSEADLPDGWTASGGKIGVRTFNLQWIQFEPVIVDADTEFLTFSGTVDSDSQLGIAIFDNPGSAGSRGGEGDIMQSIPIAAPRFSGLPLPDYDPSLGGLVQGNSRTTRIERAQNLDPFLSETDVLQSMVPRHGDYRLIAAQRYVGVPGEVPDFVKSPKWGLSRFAHSLREEGPADQLLALGRDESLYGFIPLLQMPQSARPDLPINPINPDFHSARRDGGQRGRINPAITGDFDNGTAMSSDGSYINRPDDGETRGLSLSSAYFEIPEPDAGEVPDPVPGIFSPQRSIPSPVMFGSLPTGVKAGVPWQTLLFRPDENHYGAKAPHDHLLLDFFWMPVVEPRPISRPFETEGKVNLN
ncbi:MAG: Verru_Chthon cassette protein A, partial [Verrucomicrobiota bacterium]